jgi:hypothetical protein
MGGIGIGLRSSGQLNNLNPASHTAFDSLSVLYAFGFNTGYNNIESDVEKLQRTDSRFGYFALGFKGNKYWGSSFGVAPATKVDYTYREMETTDLNGDIYYYFHGSGGLNKAYWSNSFQITPNLSLGITTAYLFGAINKMSSVFFASEYLSDNETSYTKIKRKLNVSDFTFDYGIQYQFDLKDNSKLVLGAVYQNKIKLNTKQSILGGSSNANIDDDFYKDIYPFELSTVAIDTSNMKGIITLPNSFGIGFTYIHKDKLIVGADVIQERWSKVNNDVYGDYTKDLLSAKAGIELTPDGNSVNHYLAKVHYRLGGHYTQTQLEINNTRINDYGISFGIGLPLRNTKTSFNISCEFGQRGTLDQNLLKETYGIVSLNLSLSDIWFVKRKFK